MSRTILLVEDSVTQALHVQELLSRHGYAAEVATDGRAGLQRARELMPDLLISDVVMPGMDGYELCQELRLDPALRRVPVILLTDRRTPADILHGLEVGADNFITKPIEDDYLLRRVERIFENLEYRTSGQFEVEILLTVGQRTITINADKQQIVELLFATSEELSVVNEKLTQSQRALAEHAANLEARVEERTEELKTSLEVLKRTTEDRRILADRLMRAEEIERRRIAEDVHDDSIQVMAAAAIRLSALAQRVSDPEQRTKIEQVTNSVQEAVKRLRQLVFRLVPPALEREGLTSVLRMYFGELERDWGLEITFEDEVGREPPASVGVLAYRIVQEALMNVCKHAQAAKVEVIAESVDKGIRVTIADDGRGFLQKADSESGFGTRTMRERTEMAGGRFDLWSAPGRGTTVSLWIPVSAREDED